LQVSDRRVTDLNTGQLIDSKTNKAVLFCNHVSFAYTGLATLDGRPTDWWLADALGRLPKGSSLSDAVDLIARLAEPVIRKVQIEHRFKRLAFAGSGWTVENGRLVPAMCEVGNFYDEHGKPMPIPTDSFKATLRTYPDPVGAWFDTGVELTPAEGTRLQRLFVKCGRHGVGPKPIVRLFADMIREIAGRSSRVGRDLMVTIIPKGAVESGSITARSPSGAVIFPNEGERIPDSLRRDWRTIMEFSFLPEGSTRSFDFAPNVACPGVASVRGVEMFTAKKPESGFPPQNNGMS
jgi:hypothetical protein